MKKTLIYLSLIAFIAFACKDNTIPADDEGTGMLENSDASMEKIDEADIDEDNTALPAKFLLSGPPIISQGTTSKCVAFSGAYYILSMYNGVKSNDLDKSASPEYMYAKYKSENKDPKCDEGCLLFSSDNELGASEILKQFGTTSWNQMPFVDANACSTLNATQNTQAANNKIKNYYRLDKKEYKDVNELKTWIYAGYPIWFGVAIDEGFHDLGANDVWNKASGKDDGSHAMVIDGYDDAKKAFRIANSWGTDWADGGYGWVDYDYFLSLLTAEAAPEIGILVPNDIQRANMSKVSPAACASGTGWGDIVVNNQRNEEIAIEMTGANNYNNNEMGTIDAAEEQFFTRIPSGSIKVKVLKADKSSTIKEYTANVSQCRQVIVDVQ